MSKRKSFGKYQKYVGKKIKDFEILEIVVRRVGIKKCKNKVNFKYKCCFCGNISYDAPFEIFNVKKSCGCNKHKVSKCTESWSDERKLKRRLRATAYDQWRRCNLPECIMYQYYGGRGIEFRFKSIRHAVDYYLKHFGKELQKHPHLSIDRIDNDGHYEPGNLRLATKSEQKFNHSLRHINSEAEDE